MKNYRYVNVVFEDTFESTEDNPKFYGRAYTYKTNKDYKVGQIVNINSFYGNKRAVIIKDNVEPNEISVSLDIIKEI